jgi:hypothetical protein
MHKYICLILFFLCDYIDEMINNPENYVVTCVKQILNGTEGQDKIEIVLRRCLGVDKRKMQICTKASPSEEESLHQAVTELPSTIRWKDGISCRCSDWDRCNSGERLFVKRGIFIMAVIIIYFKCLFILK